MIGVSMRVTPKGMNSAAGLGGDHARRVRLSFGRPRFFINGRDLRVRRYWYDLLVVLTLISIGAVPCEPIVDAASSSR